MTDWHSRTQRPQQLARALASIGHQVIYLNPHLGREFRQLRLFDNDHHICRVEENILELHVRLPREPVFHDRMLLPAESRIISNAIQETVKMIALRDVVQVASLPIWLEAALNVRAETGSPIIYDCHDHIAGLPKMASEVAAAETVAMQSADRVLFSSSSLRNQHEGAVPTHSSILLRNATDAAKRLPPRKASAQNIARRPVAGYVGALGTWFDVTAVQRAAESNPDIDFVLAGSVELDSIQKLGSLANVSLLGEVPHTELPALYASFDIGLIPFRLNELTRATDPIKFYEYCAYGLPIVSTRLPELERYADVVYFASGPEEFALQVRRSLVASDELRIKRELEIAATETWLARARVLSGLFSQLLPDDSLDR